MSNSTVYIFALLGAWAVLVSPVLVCAFLSIFRGRGVRGRWVFLFAGPLLAYTVLWLFLLVLYVPTALAVIFLVPSTVDLFKAQPFWFPLASWVVGKEPFIAAGACGLLSTWLSIYVWPRWPGVFTALRDPVNKGQ